MAEKTIKSTAPSSLKVWKITETSNDLFQLLDKIDIDRIDKFKNQTHQLQFLAKQILLKELDLLDKLTYLPSGKPVLNDGNFISISHSRNLVAVATGSQEIGIDLEFLNPKLSKIATRFVHIDDQTEAFFNELENLQMLWTAKESIYKLIGERGISFKEDILISDFDNITYTGQALFKKTKKINLFFNKIDTDFLLCQAFFAE